MNAEKETKTQAPLTGRRYNSVEEMMHVESVSPEVRAAVSEMDNETSVVRNLIEMRRAAGMTQQQLAEQVGKSQGAISKLESSLDKDVTVGELMDYVKATQQHIILNIGKEMSDMEYVKWHASGIRIHLMALAKAAHQDGDIEQAVQAFFGEAFFNLLNILAKCHQELPSKSGVQVRLGRVGRRISPMRAPTYIDPDLSAEEPQLA